MPIILKNWQGRRAFNFGRASAMRSTSELVDQLQEQLRREREQHKFNLAQKESELALLRELAEVRWELARRDTRDALAACLSPSPSVH
jgi:hypothetical protein